MNKLRHLVIHMLPFRQVKSYPKYTGLLGLLLFLNTGHIVISNTVLSNYYTNHIHLYDKDQQMSNRGWYLFCSYGSNALHIPDYSLMQLALLIGNMSDQRRSLNPVHGWIFYYCLGRFTVKSIYQLPPKPMPLIRHLFYRVSACFWGSIVQSKCVHTKKVLMK